MASETIELRIGGKVYRLRATTVITDEITDPPGPPSEADRARFTAWLNPRPRRVCKCGVCSRSAWAADPSLRSCPGCGAVWPENLRDEWPRVVTRSPELFTCGCGARWPVTHETHRCNGCDRVWTAEERKAWEAERRG